jgi:hypothetical protein
MDKKIEFYPTGFGIDEVCTPPLPSVHANIPTWFRDAPKYRDHANSLSVFNGENNLTVRNCIPLLEGFTSGYVMTLHTDIQVKRIENNKVLITWIDGRSNQPAPITTRPNYEERPENRSFPAVDGFDRPEFNWMPFWNVKTPPGYSCLFTHPINRLDLPFYTLGGVMDTDKWGQAGNHPFLLKSGWEGVIPKGTPMFQFIPFKREDWKSEVTENNNRYMKMISLRDSVLHGWYKKNAWSTKRYR